MRIITTVAAALKGKRTYILSGLTIAVAIAGVITKTMAPADAIAAIAVATGLSTTRAGAKDDANRVIAHVSAATAVITQLAPIAVAAAPGEAKTIEEVAALATRISAATASAPAI